MLRALLLLPLLLAACDAPAAGTRPGGRGPRTAALPADTCYVSGRPTVYSISEETGEKGTELRVSYLNTKGEVVWQSYKPGFLNINLEESSRHVFRGRVTPVCDAQDAPPR